MVTAVKHRSVLHEFSLIQGVVEDATDIILNLKQIPQGHSISRRRTIAREACEVRARDIVADGDVEVLSRTLR